MIASPKDAKPEEKEKARTKAEGILLRLNKGEAFAKLAGEFSDDQNSAAKGGELAPITLGKTNSEEFEKAAFALKKAGEISSVVQSSYGFHIIKLDERQDKKITPFAEVRDLIYNKLKTELEQKKAQQFIEQVVKEAGMEVVGEKADTTKMNNDTNLSTVNTGELKK
jgi:peptidyl-prolyl cis-trans isomerase C